LNDAGFSKSKIPRFEPDRATKDVERYNLIAVWIEILLSGRTKWTDDVTSGLYRESVSKGNHRKTCFS
jgi:hypothetical protein